MQRRNFLGLATASALLGGCANSVAGRTLSTAFETSFGNASSFDPDYPDKLPYASMAVSIRNSRKALLVLAKVDQGELHWMSADRGVFVTRNGRLVRTVGMPENLVGTEFLGVDFFEERGVPSASSSSRKRLIDIAPGNRFGMVVEASLSHGPKEVVRINKRQYETVRLVETCVVPQLSWEFQNTYWMDGQGMIWKSIQHTVQGAPAIEMEVTKPASV
ncbi:MAG TPA: YjbF family lipoprotein [Rhodocyclaceae bacterium]|nr:YjbF family lipoprotein [Rhodocyclaceae bacterium]